MPKVRKKLIYSNLLNKKSISPSEKEIQENPPSRSAKLRYVIKKKIFMILKLIF